MDIKTLESFKLSDAVKFHDELNPKLWDNNELRPEVKKQLLLIAEDFLMELGIGQLNVKDITISGSNAAYSYTPHSDLDLHILVDMSKLSNNEVYKELFTAKKNLYNDSHDIKVHGVPVELYVQDSNEPVVSLGEYSILKNKWLKIPIKRKANFDQTVTVEKYKKLLRIINSALKTKDLSKLDSILSTIKRYRKAGLDKGGEFGPENLAYKALRTQGYIDKLYDLRNKLHSNDLSIEEGIFYSDPTQLIDLYFRKIDNKDLSKTTLTKILQGLPYSKLDKALDFISKKYKIKPTDVVWQPSSKTNEDFHPNETPPGPEFKPTMPKGTVRVDVSDVYDWYKLGQHISNMKGLGKHDFGKGPPSTILSFGDEDTEHKYIQDLMKTGLSTTDIDPAGHKKIKGQKVDPTFNVNEKINPKITEPGFKSEKIIQTAKGPIKLVASTPSDSTEVFPQFYIKGFNEQGRPVSYLRLNMRDLEKFSLLPWKKKDFKNSFLVAGNVSVYDDYQRLGIASEMYKFAKELGNDIKPSDTQTSDGKAMWRGFEKNKVIGEEEKPKQASKSAIYSTDVYGMTAYHSKCLEPGCDWESKRYDSIKLAQNAAQKHAQKHFKKGVAEGSGNNNVIAQKIFFARSKIAPKAWSYDHVGFITQDGKQIQMSGHKGNDVYITNDVTDDPEFPQQQIKVVSLPKPVSVPTTNSVGAENCGTFVANVLQANGVKGFDTEKLYRVFKKPKQQGMAEGYSNTTFNVDRRKLNVPALIQKGAIFVTYPHGEQGWETDNKEDWAFSLLSLYNVLQGGWPSEAKKYLKPESYRRAEQQINSSAPNLGSDKLVYDGKYNQILWSIKKLGIPDNVAFLDKDKQGVAEAFDQPYKLKWEKSEHGDYDALATLDDGTYLTIMFNNEYKKNWMVEFYRNNSQEVTGEGDAQRIFATVLAAIKQFITKKKPESLFFSAVKEDDPTGSRTKLYDRLVQRYASNLGYNIQKQEHPGQMAYKLTRISNVKESASGYIPSNAEKDDPRFKTALTVDIKPDTMKKDAKKFGNKISRAGIPPTLKPSGKF